MKELAVKQADQTAEDQHVQSLLVLTQTSIKTDEELADAEGDGGVSWDDDGFIPASRVSAVINLKLKQKF